MKELWPSHAWGIKSNFIPHHKSFASELVQNCSTVPHG
jgi:hypothetical protein